eukprot:gb/GECH01004020.1/.p1 GENE.gb/GECH01004020.1/~~gb/GECH01004020.1/.p1  ORF type:complete len:640 (+),score=120.58 gb/GECH01004020.1/:1-1920(+)
MLFQILYLVTQILKLIFWGNDRSEKRYITPQDVPRETDFIVVGGGSSGCVLVSELWERLNRNQVEGTLVLLEAGHLPSKRSHDSNNWPTALNTDQDWQYRSEKQVHLSNRTLFSNQGRVVGGSGVLNVTLFVRGSAQEYDFWNVKGWDSHGVAPHLQNIETFHPASRNDDATESFSSSFYSENDQHDKLSRGTKGKIHVEESPRTPLNNALLESAKEMFNIDQVNPDYNQSRGAKDIGLTQFNTTQGKRNDGYRTLIRPLLEKQEKMGSKCTFRVKLITGCHVNSIEMDKIDKTAKGVNVTMDGYSDSFHIKANKEVILSSGALGSPKLLMLSGIGDQEHLESMGINTVHNSPYVGQNLQDHHIMTIAFINLRKPCDSSPQNGSDFMAFEDLSHEPEVEQAIQQNEKDESHLPPMCQYFSLYGEHTSNAVFFLFTEYVLLLIPGVRSLMQFSWIRWITTEISRFNTWLLSPILRYAARNLLGILANNAHPRSRGYVRLRSCDPFDKPLVNHKIWSHPSDVTILRKGVEHVLKLSRSQPLADEYQPFLPDPFLERDIEDSIRRTSITLCHPCGTCRLGNQGDEKAVVDERLRVQGVSGLRVADGSVIPFITSGNTNGTCLMIGDKAAAIIMKDHYELNRK